MYKCEHVESMEVWTQILLVQFSPSRWILCSIWNLWTGFQRPMKSPIPQFWLLSVLHTGSNRCSGTETDWLPDSWKCVEILHNENVVIMHVISWWPTFGIYYYACVLEFQLYVCNYLLILTVITLLHTDTHTHRLRWLEQLKWNVVYIHFATKRNLSLT